MVAVAPFELPTGVHGPASPAGHIRHMAVDERGVGLRATMRLERGFVNLSLWNKDVCAQTFHLTPAEAARLVGFLVDGLARAVPEPAPPPLAVAPPPSERPSDPPAGYRRRLAEALEHAATQLRR